MTRSTRMILAAGLTLAAAAAVIVVTAALTSWFVLLALIPLVMMVGCIAMMAAMAQSMPPGPMAAQWRSWIEGGPVTTGPKAGDGRVRR